VLDSNAAAVPRIPNPGTDGLWERQITTWASLGAPLRPGPEDVARFDEIVARWSRANGVPRGLVLGSTPELAGLRWPAGSHVLAVDRSETMVRSVWPGHPEPGRGGVCADWSSLPLPTGSRDLVLGDGAFTNLSYPDGHRAVLASIRRVLSPDGLVAVRFFVRPDTAESPEAVFADLRDGRIGSLHAFKWRLAMSLQEDVRRGVELGTIWNVWADAIDPRELSARLGWPPEAIATMDHYRDLDTRYTFPTLRELRAVFGDRFEEADCRIPSYELGDRCPMVTLRPVPRGPARP